MSFSSLQPAFKFLPTQCRYFSINTHWPYYATYYVWPFTQLFQTCFLPVF